MGACGPVKASKRLQSGIEILVFTPYKNSSGKKNSKLNYTNAPFDQKMMSEGVPLFAHVGLQFPNLLPFGASRSHNDGPVPSKSAPKLPKRPKK